MHIFCILNISKPATINASSSHWLTLYCSSHVMQSSAGLLWYYNVFDIHCGGAVHDGNTDMGTYCIYHICQLGMTSMIISIFKNSFNVNPIHYSSSGHDICIKEQEIIGRDRGDEIGE